MDSLLFLIICHIRCIILGRCMRASTWVIIPLSLFLSPQNYVYSLLGFVSRSICGQYSNPLVTYNLVVNGIHPVTYIRIYIYTYIYFYIGLYISIHIYTYLYTYTYLYISIHVYTYLYISTWDNTCLYTHTYTHIYIYCNTYTDYYGLLWIITAYQFLSFR